MASSSACLNRKVTFRSSDGEDFVVEEKVAAISQKLKNMIENGLSSSDTIHVPHVNGETLSAVLDYCTRHANKEAWKTTEDLHAFDNDLVDGKDLVWLLRAASAAKDLDIKGLLDILCKKVADMISGLGITWDDGRKFTPEEVARYRKQIPLGAFVGLSAYADR